MKGWKIRGAGALLAAAMAVGMEGAAYGAEAIEDAQARIRELERQMQQLSEQLKAVQAQLAQSSPPQPAEPAAAAPTVTADGSPVEASFKNGLVLRDASGDWALRVYARAQLDARYFTPDAFDADTFSMRRARIGVIATFYDDFTLRLEGEYAGDKTFLNDGYLDYTHYKGAMLRLGQFKTMHGLERAQGAMDLNFMERALSESVIGAVFDRGIMLHGAPLEGMYYNLAYVNGSGQNTDEPDARADSKDWSLRVVGNLAQWAGWSDSVVHVGGFYVDGRQAAGTLIPAVRTEARGVEFFKVDKAATGIDRSVRGVESALAQGPVKYQGEYIRASYDGGGGERDISAWYASLQWLVSGEHYADFYKGGTFAGIVPKNSFRHGRPGWGALELGVRYTHFDASDFHDDLLNDADKTYTDGAEAWTLGAKWVLNTHAQMQLNYVHTTFDAPIMLNGETDDREQALNMRVQFDF